MKDNLNTLELFAGSNHFTRMAKSMGMNTFCSDIQNFDGIDYPVNILDFDYSRVPFIPDIIWASPCCEKWSLAGGREGGNLYWESRKDVTGKLIGMRPRTNFNIKGLVMSPDEIKSEREQHINILKKTVDIIKHYHKLNPNLVWFIENPAFGYMKFYLPYLIDFVTNTVTYCQYGFDYRKETNIFSDIRLNLKTCKKGDPCHTDSFYSGGTDERKMKRILNGLNSVNTYYDKSKIPFLLCKEILLQSKKHIENSLESKKWIEKHYTEDMVHPF